MSVNSAPNWNSIPILRRIAYRPSWSRSRVYWPSTYAVPSDGRITPAMMRKSVVLPQPDWPMMPITLPRGMVMVTSRSTGGPPA